MFWAAGIGWVPRACNWRQGMYGSAGLGLGSGSTHWDGSMTVILKQVAMWLNRYRAVQMFTLVIDRLVR
jgi:hypothetical protein